MALEVSFTVKQSVHFLPKLCKSFYEMTCILFQLEVIKTSGKPLGKVSVTSSSTVKDLKKEIGKNFRLPIERQSIRNGPKGKDEKDNQQISKLSLESPNTIYVKDLGPQVGWDTVFFLEYAGPIVLYGALFLLPQCFYSNKTIIEGKGADAKNIFPFYIFPIELVNNICGGTTIKVQYTAQYVVFFLMLRFYNVVFQFRRNFVDNPLWQENFRNGFRASIFSRHDADFQFVQELFILLGICGLRGVSRKPPFAYACADVALRFGHVYFHRT